MKKLSKAYKAVSEKLAMRPMGDATVQHCVDLLLAYADRPSSAKRVRGMVPKHTCRIIAYLLQELLGWRARHVQHLQPLPEPTSGFDSDLLTASEIVDLVAQDRMVPWVEDEQRRPSLSTASSKFRALTTICEYPRAERARS